MFDIPKELSGFSGQLNYVAACPNQPENKEAFCEEHKEKAKSLGIPTTLGDYVKYKRKGSKGLFSCRYILYKLLLYKYWFCWQKGR